MFPFINNIFQAKEQQTALTDIHAHILPGLDDGAKTMEDAIAIIRAFKELGYQKLVATPHVLSDCYSNSREDILATGKELKATLHRRGIDISIEISAEYYLDEHFLYLLEQGELLPFGDNQLLVELSTIGRTLHLEQFFYKIISKGYQPILAHPERYLYLTDEDYDRLWNMGVQFQLNLLAFEGYYGSRVNKRAKSLLKKKYIHFLGSDIHHLHQMPLVKKMIKNALLRSILSKQMVIGE